jgi:hypothetical protein
MEILALVVVIVIWIVSRVQLSRDISSLQIDVYRLTRQVETLQSELQEKVATKADLHSLEYKLSKKDQKPFYLDDDSTF